MILKSLAKMKIMAMMMMMLQQDETATRRIFNAKKLEWNYWSAHDPLPQASYASFQTLLHTITILHMGEKYTFKSTFFFIPLIPTTLHAIHSPVTIYRNFSSVQLSRRVPAVPCRVGDDDDAEVDHDDKVWSYKVAAVYYKEEKIRVLCHAIDSLLNTRKNERESIPLNCRGE